MAGIRIRSLSCKASLDVTAAQKSIRRGWERALVMGASLLAGALLQRSHPG
jgi:hypothetical protein